MNTEQDKFLAEAMGGWWHYSVYTGRGNECSCGKWWSECSKNHPDFSTWEGFGKLWEWSSKQEWWDEFKYSLGYSPVENEGLGDSYIHPDRFADAVYNYLKSLDK